MNAKQRGEVVVSTLKEKYPEAICSLEYNGEAWRLMVMGRLSAQCTDARVNEVCRLLFKRFPTPASLAAGDISEIEELIRPCGLFRVKASDIKAECDRLVNVCGGVLPDTMEALLEFPGIGRKIAGLLLGDIYAKPAIVADTHCIRICGRLGFYPEKLKAPYKVERLLSQCIEPTEQAPLCHRLVLFGRDICSARAPKCKECPLFSVCVSECKK